VFERGVVAHELKLCGGRLDVSGQSKRQDICCSEGI
jgi:hypothetical protein